MFIDEFSGPIWAAFYEMLLTLQVENKCFRRYNAYIDNE